MHEEEWIAFNLNKIALPLHWKGNTVFPENIITAFKDFRVECRQIAITNSPLEVQSTFEIEQLSNEAIPKIWTPT